jgi:formylglycine-generating enzyme required for sulfatase activity
VQVGFEDADAYARWAAVSCRPKRSEFAARGGLEGAEYPWGNEFCRAAGRWRTPGRARSHQNLLEDGYEWTAPVGSFPVNGYGLHDMAGNVWEWTTDWYSGARAHHEVVLHARQPRGGERDRSVDPREEIRIPRRVMKGGSYLCAPNFCHRYRPAARMAQPIDTATCHVGFRCIVRG